MFTDYKCMWSFCRTCTTVQEAVWAHSINDHESQPCDVCRTSHQHRSFKWCIINLIQLYGPSIPNTRWGSSHCFLYTYQIWVSLYTRVHDTVMLLLHCSSQWVRNHM